MGIIVKKEDLKKLKEKISELSEHEKRLRYLYSRDISISKIYGPMIEYASIDRPWLKYYNDKSIDALVNYQSEDKSMYEALSKYANGHLNEIAMEYLGNEITYKEFMNQIDYVANSLKAINTQVDEIVPIMLPNCPEARYLIYACSKIGAIPNPIMPTINPEDFKNIIENTKCKKVFIMTNILEKYKNILIEKNISLDSVIEISPLKSGRGIYQILYLLKEKKDDFITFLEKGKNFTSEFVKRKGTNTALIEQTGGTTGLTSKGVVITNQNVYASNYQLENGGFNFAEGDSLLDILLPSISYGAAFEHLTLCNGIKNYMVPILVKKQINKYISKYKPNHIMMGPIHFEFIAKDKIKRNWQFIKNIVSGGDSMSIELENRANKKLKLNKTLVDLEQGYGESECFGACACNHSEFIKNGSVGIPHLLTTIAAFEYDETREDYTTDDELPLGKKGELCINSPVIMKEYLNNPTETNLVLKKHSDGTLWLHTGDIGYISEDGYVYITERIKDLIFRNGFKISPQKISNSINNKFKDCLDTCIVLGVPDKVERNVPVVFIKFKDNVNVEKEMKDIQEYVNSNFKGIETIKEIVVLNNIPRTSVGKIDKLQIRKNYIENVQNVNMKIKIKKLLKLN